MKIDITKLNQLQVKDFRKLREECISIAYIKSNPSFYDVVTYLNDYISQLSETTSNEYLKCVYQLEEYYHKLFEKYEC